MRRVISFMTLALIIIAINFIGCEEQQVEFDSEYIKNVTMTTSVDRYYRPEKITYTFKTDTPRIYCAFQVVNVDTSTSITTEWVYIINAANSEFQLIDRWNQFIEGDQNMAMYIINRFPNGWPPGRYAVFIYINDEPQGSVTFRVVK